MVPVCALGGSGLTRQIQRLGGTFEGPGACVEECSQTWPGPPTPWGAGLSAEGPGEGEGIGWHHRGIGGQYNIPIEP